MRSIFVLILALLFTVYPQWVHGEENTPKAVVSDTMLSGTFYAGESRADFSFVEGELVYMIITRKSDTLLAVSSWSEGKFILSPPSQTAMEFSYKDDVATMGKSIYSLKEGRIFIATFKPEGNTFEQISADLGWDGSDVIEFLEKKLMRIRNTNKKLNALFNLE